MNSDPVLCSEPASEGAPRGPLGSERMPFVLAPDADLIYWSGAHRRAADCLRRGIDRLAPITLLTGEIGSGKTMLLQDLLSPPPEDLTIGLLSYFGSGRGDLADWILLAFDLPIPDGPPALRIDTLRRFVMAEQGAGRRCLLIVDEAQSATDDDLEALRQLTNLNTGGHTLLQIVLAGQTDLRARLRAERHAPLVTRLAADAHLDPMSARDTAGYVRHRLARAGGPADLFTTNALREVHEAAHGIARATNVLCDLCLVESRSTGAAGIGGALVRDVIATIRRDGTFPGLAGAAGTGTIHQLHAARGTAAAPPDTAAPKPADPAPPSGQTPAALAGPGERRSPRFEALPSSDTLLRWPILEPANTSPSATSTDSARAPTEDEPLRRPAAADPAVSPGSAGGPDDVRALAVSAMAGLADFQPAPRGARDRKPPEPKSRVPARGPEAASTPPAREPPASAPSARPVSGPSLVIAAAALGLAMIGFGSLGLLPPIDAEPAAAPVVAVRGTGERHDGPAAEAPRTATGPTAAAAEGSPFTPRLTTPALPTVAKTDSSAEDLYELGLDLSLVDPEGGAIAFARAGSRGHARSSYYLAQLYETGDGVPRNAALARAWYAHSDVPQAVERLAAMATTPATGTVAAPRLLSAARAAEGALELVWTDASNLHAVEYGVEIFDDPTARTPVLTQRTTRSALQLSAPEQELFWRVTAEHAGAAAVSDLQRIPAAPRPQAN